MRFRLVLVVCKHNIFAMRISQSAERMSALDKQMSSKQLLLLPHDYEPSRNNEISELQAGQWDLGPTGQEPRVSGMGLYGFRNVEGGRHPDASRETTLVAARRAKASVAPKIWVGEIQSAFPKPSACDRPTIAFREITIMGNDLTGDSDVWMAVKHLKAAVLATPGSRSGEGRKGTPLESWPPPPACSRRAAAAFSPNVVPD
jgi:hypothetical protein